MLSKLVPKYENAVFLAVFLCLGLFFQFNRFNQLPTSVHPWAQSDRYALAKGFINNGFNLLKPETFLMNREFPHNFKKAEDNSITAVNLPLHEYLIALIMRLLNSESIWIFRIYNFLFSYIGLFALFKSCRLLKLSFFSSFLVVGLLFFSPNFLIYQVTTLGIVNTLSLVLLAIYWYLRFQKSKKWKHLYISLAILTIASIIRSTAFVPFVAILMAELIKSIYLKKFYWQVFPILILSLVALGLHYYYMNLHMVYHYGSVFLYYIVPATSLQEALMIADRAIELWGLHYFSHSQWILVGLLLIIGVSINLRRLHLDKSDSMLIVFSTFCLGGYILFIIAMFTKLKDHDYYIIDSLTIPIIFIAFIILKLIELIILKDKLFFRLLAIGILSLMAFNVKAIFNDALEQKPWQNTCNIIEDYEEAKVQLNQFTESNESKVLVIGAENAPNLPLLLLDKKGYVLRWQDSLEMESVLDWDYDFMLFRKIHYLNHYHSKNKNFINHFDILSNKGEVVIAKKSHKVRKNSIEEIIANKNYNLLFSDSLRRNQKNHYWVNDLRTKNGNGVVNATNEFGPTYERIIKLNTKSTIYVDYEIKCKGVEKNSLTEIVVFFENKLNSNNRYYKPFVINDFKSLQNDGFNKVRIQTSFDIEKGEGLFKVYLWNRSKDQIEYKDGSLKFYYK